jgi:hypothetical protein
MYAEAATHEPSYHPGAAEWRAHRLAVRSAGEELDAGTARDATERFGFDFRNVRVHRDAAAEQAATAMGTRAYTYGRDVFFQAHEFRPRSPLLMHELNHVMQQAGRVPAVMRAPPNVPTTTTTAAGATYIIVYGTGRLNPLEPSHHNVGALFKMAADAKRKEIIARLGAQAGANNIVFEYTPTEAELKAVLNHKYALPVKEVHIFSHGWDEGINLGGYDPGPGKTGPDVTSERRLVPADLGDYDIAWGAQPTVTLYGCNTGNASGSPAFAQSVADAFGVPVKAPTTSSHFEFGGSFGTRQVPDKPGKVKEFLPTATGLQAHLGAVEWLSQEIVAKMKTKGGLLHIMKATQDASALRDQMNPHLKIISQELGDTRVDVPNRAGLQAKVARLVKDADNALK